MNNSSLTDISMTAIFKCLHVDTAKPRGTERSGGIVSIVARLHLDSGGFSFVAVQVTVLNAGSCVGD